MAKNSSKVYVLQGLAFWPSKKYREFMKAKGMPFYPSVFSWYADGCKSPAVVYDVPDTLHSCNVPICDSIETHGAYVKTKVILKPRECEFIRCFTVSPSTPPPKGDKIKTVQGIFAADTKDHHRLNYGNSYAAEDEKKAAEAANVE